MAGSIVVDLRKAVAVGLAADPGLAGADVSYAWRPDSRERRQVFTHRARADTPPAALRSGRNHRDENGTFQVVVHCEVPGADAEEADAECVALGGAVEDWFADRKCNQLGVPGLQSLIVTGWELGGGPADRAYISQLIYTVRWTARLT